MRDLGVLKERIEYAERHLQAAHSARERESEALMAMWGQIRDRFDAQEQEIARYRDEVAELTRVNDELSALVDRLISTVEGSVEKSGNETVPEVSQLAGDLLQSEPVAGAAPKPADADPLAALETDDPLELGTPIDEPGSAGDGTSFGELLNRAIEAEDTEDTVDAPVAVSGESASDGIRDLISRIEGSVGKEAGRDADGGEDDGDELSRELREIETLRNQLSGLQTRISGGA